MTPAARPPPRPAARPRADRQFVAALARGLEVLRAFGPGDRSLSNQELARRTGLPKPTVSRLTHTLTLLGALRPARGGGHALGPAVLGLGYALLAQMDARRVARPLMQALAEHAGVAVNLGMRDRLGMVYLDTYRSAATFAVQLEVGSRIPLPSTSMGRAFLCGLPAPERRALAEELKAAEGEGWPRARKALEQAQRDHAAHGFCFSLGDWRPEIHAVAAPLLLPGEPEPLVVSCSGPAFQLPRERLVGEVGPRLLNLVGNVRSALVNA